HFGIGNGGRSNALAQGFAGYGQPILVKWTASTADLVEDGRNTTGAMHVLHMPVAGRADLADVGDAAGDLVDAFQRIVDARFVGNSKRVKHRVGAAAHGHVQGKRIVN